MQEVRYSQWDCFILSICTGNSCVGIFYHYGISLQGAVMPLRRMLSTAACFYFIAVPDPESYEVENKDSIALLKPGWLETEVKKSASLTQTRQPAKRISLSPVVLWYTLTEWTVAEFLTRSLSEQRVEPSLKMAEMI